jgi:mannose-1-phosphate guanylyltransferase
VDVTSSDRGRALTAGFGGLWAVLLAAGDGKRIASLTHDLDGESVPKQFWAADGRRSMIRWAIDRAARVVPAERLVTVVASHHRCWWSGQLSDLPARNIVVQPRNRGTAAGLLLPLLEILRRDPLATILVLPSDHYVSDEPVLAEAMTRAVEVAQGHPDRVVLLGMQPTDADVEYGWIVPASHEGSVRRVVSFVEKPAREQAARLMERGAVLNSLILVATGMSLLRAIEDAAPRLSRRFAEWLDSGDLSGSRLDRVYRHLAVHDFSREVLERSVERLDVLNVEPCGWSDLGTPARLSDYCRRVGATKPRVTGSVGANTSTTPPVVAAVATR